MTGYDPKFIRAAAIFYIYQVLWTSDADHYRILGVNPDASPAQLTEHIRWLAKWLHPDADRPAVKRTAVTRVMSAWDAVKTPERRRAYEQQRTRRPDFSERPERSVHLSARRIPWIASAGAPWAGTSVSARRLERVLRAAAAALALAIVLSLALIAQHNLIGAATDGTTSTEFVNSTPN